MLADFQRKFADGLREQNRPTPTLQLSGHANRLSIHLRNSRLSLRMAVEDAFSVTKRLVGSDFFALLADEFVATQPPKHGWLSAYGEEFSAFLQGHASIRDLPYLPDVARLEWARVHAGNAPDAAGLDLSVLATMEPETLEKLRLSLHQAATLICSPFPVFDIWQVHQHTADDDNLPPMDLSKGAQNILVSRPGRFEIGVASLHAGDAALLSTLEAKAPFAAACQAAVMVEEDYDLGARLGELVCLRSLAALAQK